MAFVSLLWREVQSGAEPEGKAPMPDFFLDLNIDQLFKLIKDQAPGYDLSQMYYRFPQDEEETRYRREVYRDVKTPQIYECLEAFSKQMRTVAKALENRTAIEDQLQINAWHSTAAALYCRAVHLLWEQISQLPVQSQGLKQLTEDLCAYVQRKDFLELKKAACHIREQMENIRLILRIENNKITVTHGSLEGAYETFLGGEGGEQASPFAADMRMSPLEEEIFAVYRKKYPQLFRDIQQFSESFPAFGEEDIFRLEKELQYYLAFYRFQQKMESWNCCFTEPETDEGKEMEARDLYDLALAASNFAQNKPVVANDFVYHEGEAFFVVNGPNQGGKTTFARSLGQLIYFAKMGFDVPAGWANVHTVSGLMTHFSVEESMETGQGKLMEELSRLAPMMRSKVRNAFVIINELFTTAAHYDGCIMGAKVLEHFIAAGCRGIYVTHLKELGSSIEKVVSMTAMLDGSEAHRRTYKILRREAEDAGYAEDIVKKYELTYPLLKERLAEFFGSSEKAPAGQQK